MPALLYAASRSHNRWSMDQVARAWSCARVGASVCRDLDRQRLPIGSIRKLAPTANVHRYRLPFCRSAQLVRSSLFSHAPAGALWPLAKLLHGCVRGNWIAHADVCFVAGALLREHLVGRELAQRDRDLEHADDFVDRRAGAYARKTESES